MSEKQSEGANRPEIPQQRDSTAEGDPDGASPKYTRSREHWTNYRGNLSVLSEIRAGHPSTTDSARGDESSPIEDRDLRVELEIERGGPCVMDSIEKDIVGVDVMLTDEQCRVDLDVKGESEQQPSTKQFTSDVCDHCPGMVFPKYGCIPRYLDVGTGSFVMETYLPDSEAVSSLVTELRERCERVKIRSLTSTEQQNYTEPCTIDLTPLTPKQREAIHTAQELGYYEPCSDVELGDVAEELDISSSALSQRLQRGEANVIEQLSCERGWQESE